MKRARFNCGSVVFDKRRKTWNLLRWIEGKRKTQRLGTLAEYRTKSAAQRAAQQLQMSIVDVPKPQPSIAVADLVQQYRIEKMPTRAKTREGYETWLKCYIVPTWGNCDVHDLQARPVELWLDSLKLAPKSKAHIRGLIRTLWEFAMWKGDIPTQRNPMELVTVRGASKRLHKPRSLTVEEFQKFIARLEEPYRTIALLSVCLGLRISECLALKWSDVNWLAGTISIERRIVARIVDATKTHESQKKMAVDFVMLDVLMRWKQTTEFSENDDLIFASPTSIGRFPFSYWQVWDKYKQASKDAELGHVSTHVLRHTYRSWLDSVGTSLAVQQKMMRHTDIRTTMNVYGDVVTNEMTQAGTKIAQLALNGLPADRQAC